MRQRGDLVVRMNAHRWLHCFMHVQHQPSNTQCSIVVSIVSFGPSVLSGRQYAPLSLSCGRGRRVLQRVGVMDRATMCLPAAVEGFGPWEGGLK